MFPVDGHSEVSAGESEKPATLVVDVSDLASADSLSLASLDTNSNYQSEEPVRSSPASTILRPRSGKEYQKVERRRTLDDSSATSPLTTPQSPILGSVFTFDNIGTAASILSGVSSSCCDPHSPKLFKGGSSMSEQASVSARSDSVMSPLAFYMNLDFTSELSPPESPMLAPAEQVDPTLNYAEIDLSEAGRSEAAAQAMNKTTLNYAEMDLTAPERPGLMMKPSFKKSNKKVPEPVPIEYSMIDMVATRAAQKARKEHAQSRDGSLHRERYSSTSSHAPSTSSTKERVANLSLSRAERRQISAANAAKSTSSVDSSHF